MLPIVKIYSFQDYVRILGYPTAHVNRNLSRVPTYVPVYIDWEVRVDVVLSALLIPLNGIEA